ncbi:hypothetical protein OXV71_23505, partial [Bacteroides fragilis]|nr:hypothetical protein [Bacteroides fragilis]
VKVIAVLNPGFPEAWRMVEAGQIAGFAYIWLLVFLVLLCCFVLWRIVPKGYFRKKKPETSRPAGEWVVSIPTHENPVVVGNPFRGIFIAGRQDRESPRVSQCPCSLSSSARDLPGSCTISSSRLLTMHFRQVDGQYRQSVGQQPDSFVSGADIMEYYNRVKEDIKGILGQS